jgi:hypothetical protein
MSRPKGLYAVSDHPLARPLLTNVMGALAVHWVFQGLLYMDRTERWFKLLLDALLCMALAAPLLALTPLPPAGSIAIALVSAHTVNWAFNGHIPVVLKHFNKVSHDHAEWTAYIDGLKRRASRQGSLSWMAAYGSLARGEFSPSSDLDVRIIRRPGLANGLAACWFAARERARAFRSGFPLDLYVLDDPRPLRKLKPEERPVVLYDASAAHAIDRT